MSIPGHSRLTVSVGMSDVPFVQRAVLRALLDLMDWPRDNQDAGGEWAKPRLSLSLIMKRSGGSRSTVKRALSWLEAQGYIVRAAYDAGGKRDYRVCYELFPAPQVREDRPGSERTDPGQRDPPQVREDRPRSERPRFREDRPGSERTGGGSVRPTMYRSSFRSDRTPPLPPVFAFGSAGQTR